ncbi:unnamed protein product [Eruca vesicaria subsp. sativa]|uniref:Cytochrome P450 n=1 Tax=Eruca vesicaria subsp. sativa TaxID=29727 RepID=A0ABC8K2Z1_ERUVS|nr:unnamed protein product [Eruca vesicaria subsp. sativa]
MVSFDCQSCFFSALLFFFLTLFLFAFFSKKPKNELPPSPPSLPVIGYLHLFVLIIFGENFPQKIFTKEVYQKILRQVFYKKIFSLNFLFLFASIHKSFQKISSTYGRFLHIRILNLRIVLVSSASVIYEIFKAQDINVSYRGDVAIDECMMLGLFGFIRAPCGDYLKFMKKIMMTKMIGPQALERSRGVRELELERFYKNLLDKAIEKQSVDIGEEAIRLVTYTLGKMSMGSVFSQDNNEAVSKLCVEFGALSPEFFIAQVFHKMLQKVGISVLKRNIMDVSNRFDELLEKILVKYEEQQLDVHQGNEFMDALLAASRDEDAEYKITRKHIKGLFTELFFGAGDTSSTTTQWAMAEIINNPNILERLREEIDSVVGKERLIQETDLPKLPYLQAVINESLRLHPVGPVLPREFQQGCTVGGFYIAEGTILVMNAYDVMRDPDYWEDPNTFKPERFLASSRSWQEEKRREHALKFLSFGAGRRRCMGSNLGYTLVGTAIGVMVQHFDWEIKGDEVNMEEASGLRFFLGLAHPLKCTPLPRIINH